MREKGSKPKEEGEEYALRLLAMRDHSREEMRRKLADKGFSADEVEEVLRKLEAGGLLDDLRYAQRLASSLAREKLLGPQRVIQKLMQKGIPFEVAREMVNRVEEDLGSDERLRRVLRMKLKGQVPEELLPNEKRRLANYLRRRGFFWEDIMEVLQKAGGLVEE